MAHLFRGNGTPTGCEPASSPANDLELVREVIAGRSDALERFIHRMDCVPLILANRNARFDYPLRAGELADLAQDTLAVIWSRLSTYAGEAALESWVYAYCIRSLMNAIRSKSSRRLSPIPEQLGEPGSNGRSLEKLYQRAELVHRNLERLQEQQARVIRLRHFEALGFEEIAARLSSSVAAVKSQYQRGLEHLRAYLSPHLKEPAP